MTRGLTDKQERILGFIMDYVNEHGYPPSIREIGNAFHITSLRGVTVHLDALERKGYIKRMSTSRSITVIGKTGAMGQRHRDVAFIPLVGTIAAGIPLTATQNVEGHIPIPAEMLRHGSDLFALKVRGESMINAHIMPDDMVIIKPQQNADNGDLVAVLLGDEATVKHIEFGEDGVRLLAANPAFEPIPINQEDSAVIGKVIGLIRNYDMALSY